jgi:hypothetical protein
MPKNRASFLKRQREIAQKEQRQAKLQRRLDRKAGTTPSHDPDELNAPQPDPERAVE